LHLRASAGVETKTLQENEKYLESGSLDTPLEEHSGLHLDRLDAALDHRKLVDF
jgi:hypothetical protein